MKMMINTDHAANCANDDDDALVMDHIMIMTMID